MLAFARPALCQMLLLDDAPESTAPGALRTNPFLEQVKAAMPDKFDPALEPGEEPLTCGGCSFFGRKDGRGFCTLRIFYVDAQERGCEFFDPMLSDASYT